MSFLTAPFRLVGNVAHATGDFVQDVVGGGREERHDQQHYHRCDDGSSNAAALLLQAQAQQAALQRQEQTRLNEAQYIQEKIAAGNTALENRDYQGALTQFRCVLNKDRDHFEAKEGVKQAHNGLGRQYRTEGNPIDAIKSFLRAGAEQEILQTMRSVLQTSADLEQQADMSLIQDTSKEVHTALKSYQENQGQLSLAEGALNQKYRIDGLAAQQKNLAQKIQDAKNKLQMIKAKALVDEAAQSLEKFKKSYEDDLAPGSDPAKGVLEEHKRQLSVIFKKYESAKKIDPSIPLRGLPELNRLILETDEKIERCTVQEYLQMMTQAQKNLPKYSLKREQDLDQIVRECNNWLNAYNLCPASQALKIFEQNRATIEQIKEMAEIGAERLGSLDKLGVEIMEAAVEKLNPMGRFPQKQHQAANDQLIVLFKGQNIRNQVLSLLPAGWEQFKVRLADYQSERMVSGCSVWFCMGVKNYKTDLSKPIQGKDVVQMLNECFELGPVEDVAERLGVPQLEGLGAPPPYQLNGPVLRPPTFTEDFPDVTKASAPPL